MCGKLGYTRVPEREGFEQVRWRAPKYMDDHDAIDGHSLHGEAMHLTLHHKSDDSSDSELHVGIGKYIQHHTWVGFYSVTNSTKDAYISISTHQQASPLTVSVRRPKFLNMFKIMRGICCWPCALTGAARWAYDNNWTVHWSVDKIMNTSDAWAICTFSHYQDISIPWYCLSAWTQALSASCQAKKSAPCSTA